MGGFGSTRWGWRATRRTTDGLPALDVRVLARSGCFGRPGTYALSWARPDGGPDSIAVRVEGVPPDAVALAYRLREDGGPWHEVGERVELERTVCPFGGTRPWFACPGCGARRAVLHLVGVRFRCRSCHDLAYGSAREATWERARRKASRLRRRLGTDGLAGLSPKPKGMQRRTYDRLVAELRATTLTAEAGVAARSGAVIAHAAAFLEQFYP